MGIVNIEVVINAITLQVDIVVAPVIKIGGCLIVELTELIERILDYADSSVTKVGDNHKVIGLDYDCV